MINTDEKNKLLSNFAYNIDGNNKDYSNVYEGKSYKYDDDRPGLGEFKILALEDNQENGMQAMAVAPINSAGEINTIINTRNEPKALFFLSRNMI